MKEYKKIREEQGIEYGLYHFDIPLTAETEMHLLQQAGFEKVYVHKKWDNTIIFVCHKI
jgi:hypothetical protein